MVLIGCSADRPPEVQEELLDHCADLHFACSGLLSRSQYSPEEDGLMEELCLFAFGADGNLEFEDHWTFSGDGVADFSTKFTLRNGTHHLYAVANSGDFTGKYSKESELVSGISCNMDSEDWHTSGFPMAGKIEVNVQADCSPEIHMERLVARYSFRLDASGMDHGGRLIVKDIQLRQCADKVCPFSGPSGSSSVVTVSFQDGDRASSSDLTSINAGRAIELYVPENLQGEDERIDESDRKVPDNLASPQECTYLEVTCSYYNQGMTSEDLKYRMFLGANATSSFDVVRNTSYSLTLCPQEDRIHSAWWKCEGEFVDLRQMAFSPPALTMFLLEDAEASLERNHLFDFQTDVLTVRDDFLFDWQPETDDDFCLEMDGNNLLIHTGLTLATNMETIEGFTVTATSWDRLASASETVTVVPIYGHWDRHDVYLNQGQSVSVDFLYGGSSVWEAQGVNLIGSTSTGMTYTVGDPVKVKDPRMYTSGKRTLTVESTNLTSSSYTYKFVAMSYADDPRYIKKDTLLVHINPYTLDFASPRVCFSNGDQDSTTVYYGGNDKG